MRMPIVALGCILSVTAWARPAHAQDALDPAVADQLDLQVVVSGLDAPTAAEFLPDGRLVIIEQLTGAVKLWAGDRTPRTIGTIGVQTGFERGLLGLAVDPEFRQTRRLYLYYSQDGHQKAGWVTLDATTDQVTGPPTVIVEDMGAAANHNGGGLAFGADGNLYIGVGDTGCNCNCAPGQNQSNYYGTCLTNFQGKILRVDRDGNAPATNPLVGIAAVPACIGSDCRNGANVFPRAMGAPAVELYAWGFRNPWRFSFDDRTGFLWIGDVGEVTWEEINVATQAGQHFGWPFREGTAGQSTTECSDLYAASGACRDPAFSYPRAEAPGRNRASVTGGVFSNGCRWPEPWNGRYWFGDFAKSRVWAVTPNAARDGVDGERTVVVVGAGGPVHFTNGPTGDIYYLAAGSGTIIRLSPANPIQCEPVDAGMSDATSTVMDATSDPVVDSGLIAAPDTGVAVDPQEDDDSCSCTSTPVDPNETRTAWAWLALIALAATRWRLRS